MGQITDNFRERKETRAASTARLFNMKRTESLILLFVISLVPMIGFGGVPASVCKAKEEPGPLKLEGEIIELRLLNEDGSSIRFSVKLKLTFVNEGTEPVILLKQNFEVGAEMLARSREDAQAGKYLYTSSHWPSISNASAWINWRRQLDTQTPLPDKTAVLRPGESLAIDAQTAINIEKRGNFDRTSKPWEEIKQTPSLCLQVEVKTWPVNLEPNHDPENLELGQRLRQRWAAYGSLQLEHLRSDPIALTFPSHSSP